MLVPKSWIQDFINLKGIADQTFADEMTFAGNKVEAVNKLNNLSVFEFEITSNRPDTLSIIGLSREASAIFGLQLNLPKIPKLKTNLPPTPKLKIDEDHLCPVYSAIEIKDLKIKNSPDKIISRLKMAGITPVNNLVDVTNYLMHETGQPMHAFDADKIEGVLILRTAKKGEKFTPLDHLQRTLNGGEIIIEDQKKIIDLAGLMGGENSEIDIKTKRVYLLVPVYEPVFIRRASKALKIRTEASNRFEKQLDLTQTDAVLARAADLIIKLADGKQATSPSYKKTTYQSQTIGFSHDLLSKRIGVEIKPAAVDHFFEKLAIKKTDRGCLPPPWRRDLQTPVDLIEEVVRLHGYNKLPRTLPQGAVPLHKDSLKPNLARIIRVLLASFGYYEAYSSTLLSRTLIESLNLDPDDHLKVLHPMSSEYEYMRLTVLENLIPLISRNLEHSQNINLFELGTVFQKQSDSHKLPYQPLELAAVSTSFEYREIKGQLLRIFQDLGIEASFQPIKDSPKSYLHPSKQTEIFLNGLQIGTLGSIHPQILPSELKNAWSFKLNLKLIEDRVSLGKSYSEIPEYPPIVEDLTFSLPPRTYIGFVLDEIKISSKLIEDVKVKSIYESKEGEGKNITFSITYRHPERSLETKDVSPIRKKIVKNLKKNFKAELVGKLK